ncbi:hypothetical protein [Tritonibacter mobilis]|uniref:hypothetical protein n=1 Tax=Tritonibacter mobilis TaxID=379347 RepID=UPI000806D2E0|nr:hypothetical protein [Tritonibacter mobilis]
MTQDTSTEAVERLAKDCDDFQRMHDQESEEARQYYDCSAALRALAAERDQALARERALLDSNKNERTYLMERNAAIEDAKRLTAERDTLAKKLDKQLSEFSAACDRISFLRQQLAEARNAALKEATSEIKKHIPKLVGGIFGHTNSVICAMQDCLAYVEALKSEINSRPKSKAVPLSAPVEVCGICDIAGCHHTRELNEKMPNEIAAWPEFPDGCVTGSWSANQHHQDAVAYVRKEPAPRQSVQEAAKVLLEWLHCGPEDVPAKDFLKFFNALTKTEGDIFDRACAALRALAQET